MTDLHIALSAIQTAYGERLLRQWRTERPRGTRQLWAKLAGIAALALLITLYVAASLNRAQ